MTRLSKSEYIILPSLHEESVEGWVWFNDDSCPEQNDFIKLTYYDKTAILFRRKVDKFYQFKYNEKVIYSHQNGLISSEEKISYILFKDSKTLIINKFYRNKLGIADNQLGKKIIINVTKANFFERNLTGYWNHPNPSVSVAYRIAIISFAISIIGLLFSFTTFNFPQEGITLVISKLCFSTFILIVFFVVLFVIMRIITK
jgi:hypothetical protein